KLVEPARIAGEPVPKLLDLLKDSDDRVRYRVRIELSGRATADVMAALRPWMASLDTRNPENIHNLLEALWLCQSQNIVDSDLLDKVLTAPDFRARAAAVRVCAAWQDRLPHILDLLERAAKDDAPRVRLMAVWAASFVPRAAAAETVLLAGEK